MAKPQQHHINALTGIRFVAALGVFVQHMLGRLGVTTFVWPFGDGGVTFFFVLSGFILTYVYSHRMTGCRDLPRFYFTRWARIWPLHMVTLIFYVLFFYKLTYIFKTEELVRKLILQRDAASKLGPQLSLEFRLQRGQLEYFDGSIFLFDVSATGARTWPIPGSSISFSRSPSRAIS